MTAFDATLVAISWHKARYAVVSEVMARLDDTALERDGRLKDVSGNTSYIDEAAILHKAQVHRYLRPPSDRDHALVKNWLAGLPEEAEFVLYHRAQFESGLGD